MTTHIKIQSVKILNTKQIQALDRYTIQHEPIASIDLMERACKTFTDWFMDTYHRAKTIAVVCGTGNNGGDGLGIARLLHGAGYTVNVWIVQEGTSASDDFNENVNRLKEFLEPQIISKDHPAVAFNNMEIIIDGIFGSGLSRPATGIYAQVINQMNAASATRIAIDMPSGLRADAHSEGAIVKADVTISFQVPKLAFMLPENAQYLGRWSLVGIGLNKNFIHDVDTAYTIVAREQIQKLLKPKSTFDHKGTNGKVLLVCGSLGKMGAAVLSSRAALRAGAGLVMVHTPRCGYVVLQTAVPEAMVQVDADENITTAVHDMEGVDAVGVGPGIGQQTETLQAFKNLLEAWQKPMVIDADALNLLGANRDLFQLVPVGSILTPHPKEFERLVGKWKDDFHRLALVQKLAKELQCVVVLKGAYTTIAAPDGKIHFNSTGNPGMATGGTGDVLTGILSGLLGQGYDALTTALLGVYLHGLAGDLAAREVGMEGLIASDVVQWLPQAFRQTRG